MNKVEFSKLLHDKLIAELRAQFPNLKITSGLEIRCLSNYAKGTIDLQTNKSFGRFVLWESKRFKGGMPPWEQISFEKAMIMLKKWNTLENFL